MRNSINSSGRDLDRAKADREFRMNPPESAPGQGSFDDWNLDGGFGMGEKNSAGFSFNDSFGGGISQSDWEGGGRSQNINDLLGGSLPQGDTQSMFGSGSYGTNQNGSQGNQGTSNKIEDAVVSGGIIVAKGIVAGLKVLFEEFKEAIQDNCADDRFHFGGDAIRGSIFAIGVSLFLCAISIVAPGMNKDAILAIMVGGLLSLGVGCFFVCWYYNAHEELKKERENEEEEYDDTFGFNDEEVDDYPDADDLFSDDRDFDFNENEGEEDGGDDDFFNDWLDDEEGEEDEKVEGGVYQGDINVDSMIEDLDNSQVPVGVYTRQYLFETFSKVLPLINPNFSKMRSISDSSEDFLEYEDILREAASIAGVKDEDYLPNLIGLSENTFLVQLKVERTRQCVGKEEMIANELVSIYQYDENGQIPEDRQGVYAIVNTAGSVFYINMFTGGKILVSLGDAYMKEKSFVTDPKVVMPFIWGTDEYGNTIKSDINNMISYIISGVPRSGKSWLVQSLVLQLCMFNSPDDVIFYAVDTKGTASDFSRPSRLLPHFKHFEDKPQRILHMLRYLTTKEADRRAKILSKYNQINIADLKSKHPEVKLPYLYVLIDEMKALVGELDKNKEESREFQMLLGNLVSKLPGLGFRVILIPHRITNEIISKQIYSLISCRAAVKATFEEIKTGLEVTRKDFPYSLPSPGDMALRVSELNGNRVLYCHGLAITSKNETNMDVYRYVGAVWKKLCPGCDADMVGANEPYISREPVDRSYTGYDDVKEKEENQDTDEFEGLSVDDFDDPENLIKDEWI